jgi:hypothetical protein
MDALFSFLTGMTGALAPFSYLVRKELLSRINQIITKIIFYNTETLPQIKFKQVKLYTKDN